MKIIKQNLGVDIDSAELKVNLQFMSEDLSIKIKGSRTFKNTLIGFKKLEEWLNKKRRLELDLHITLEATGVYYENFAYFLQEKISYIVHVVLPNVSNAYLKSLNLKTKTDKIDARGLAQMGLERNLLPWQPISPQMRDLKKMTRERIRLQKEKVMVSNQLHSELAAYKPRRTTVKRYEKRIQFLESQILEIEKELNLTVNKDPDLRQKIDKVCTAKGLGFITVMGVIAEYNGFILFKNRNQVVSFAGYDVVQKQSGTSINGIPKISKKGNSYVRGMLYMSAMSAVRFDDHHKAYYNRIVNKTNIKMKGNVAIQRKLLLLIYALFKKNESYDINYHAELKEKLKSKKNVDVNS